MTLLVQVDAVVAVTREAPISKIGMMYSMLAISGSEAQVRMFDWQACLISRLKVTFA